MTAVLEAPVKTFLGLIVFEGEILTRAEALAKIVAAVFAGEAATAAELSKLYDEGFYA